MALSKRKLSPYFLLALLLVLAWVSFRIVQVFLDYVIVGLFLAYLSYAPYRWVQRRVRSPSVAAAVMLVGITAIVLVPLAFLIAQLVEELRGIIVTVSLGSVDALVASLTTAIGDVLGVDATDGATARFVRNAVFVVQDRLAGIARGLPVAVAEGIVGVFVLLYVMYYTYTDGPRLLDWLRETLPLKESHRDLLFHEVASMVRAVMFGSVLTSFIQAVLGAIGFWIFGVPGVVLWSVVMFVLALLPVVGPPLVWVPASFYLWATGRTFAAVGLFVYSLVLVSTIDNVIRPKLIGTRAHVHPVVILIGVLGGLVVFGFSGFILGPLVLSVFVTVMNVYRKEFAGRDEPQAVGDA